MPVVMIDHASWVQLEQVQAQINHEVRYETTQQRFGVVERWEPADTAGDCDGIALAKRRRLIELGWPSQSLRIATAIDEQGQLHAVLTVDVADARGEPGTYVLDSRFAHVEPWKALSDYGYSWLERAGTDGGDWRRLGDPMAIPVGAIAALGGLPTGTEAHRNGG